MKKQLNHHNFVECPCCESEALDEPHEQRSYWISALDNKVTYSYRVCSRCGHYFVKAPLNQNDLDEYYRNSEAFRRLDVSEEEIVVFNRQSQFIRKQKNLKNASVLEIGCDTGQFLSHLTKEGARTYYLEHSQRAQELLNKDGIHNFASDDSMRYDCIIMRHVLEHVCEPISFLSAFQQRLKDDGILFIEVPDWSNPGPKTDVVLFEHLHHFTLSSLTTCLSNAGFAVNHIEFDQTDNYSTTPNNVLRVLACSRPLNTRELRNVDRVGRHYKNTINRMYEKVKNSFTSYDRVGIYAASWIAQDIMMNVTGVTNSVSCVIDADPQKEGKDFFGKITCSPNKKILDNLDLIIITSSYDKEILKNLRGMGYDGEVMMYSDLLD